MNEIQNNNYVNLQSPFEQLKEVDAGGKEWWNSRQLARVMGYGKYWNFERVMAKAQAWVTEPQGQAVWSNPLLVLSDKPKSLSLWSALGNWGMGVIGADIAQPLISE